MFGYYSRLQRVRRSYSWGSLMSWEGLHGPCSDRSVPHPPALGMSHFRTEEALYSWPREWLWVVGLRWERWRDLQLVSVLVCSAARTKHHRQGGLNRWHLSVLEAGSPPSRWRQIRFLARAPSLAWGQLPPCCVIAWPFLCAVGESVSLFLFLY